MKLTSTLLLAAGICGVVGHSGHGEEGESQVPLHEQEFVQDSFEELERKWSFEVCLYVFDLIWFGCGGFERSSSEEQGHVLQLG
jgi:hypothetical protein